ncbi:hypothetical protein BD626DRAFT_30744 [Schizophyllum amplum]|uniref:Uncharacterized protein n=1 Tax=Schizophyllum amplum TaxID=97359 RepID=A0A550D0K5_9AGAR|nr:hypothetical protein BD626DRAFT_30744 [Auriculariopsis ampla]
MMSAWPQGMWAYSRFQTPPMNSAWLRVGRARAHTTGAAFGKTDRRTWAQMAVYRANGMPRSKTMGFLAVSTTAIATYYARHYARRRREYAAMRNLSVFYLTGVQISRRVVGAEDVPDLFERLSAAYGDENFTEAMHFLHAIYCLPDPDLHLLVLFEPLTGAAQEFVDDMAITMQGFVNTMFPKGILAALSMKGRAREREQQPSNQALTEPSSSGDE